MAKKNTYLRKRLCRYQQRKQLSRKHQRVTNYRRNVLCMYQQKEKHNLGRGKGNSKRKGMPLEEAGYASAKGKAV